MKNLEVFKHQETHYVLNKDNVVFYEISKHVFEQFDLMKNSEGEIAAKACNSELLEELKEISKVPVDSKPLPYMNEHDVSFNKIFIELDGIVDLEQIRKVGAFCNSEFMSKNLELNLFVSKETNIEYLASMIKTECSKNIKYSFSIDYRNVSHKLLNSFPKNCTSKVFIYAKIIANENIKDLFSKLSVLSLAIRNNIIIELDILGIDESVNDLITGLREIGCHKFFFSKPADSECERNYKTLIECYNNLSIDYFSDICENVKNQSPSIDILFGLELLRTGNIKEYTMERLASVLYIGKDGSVSSPFTTNGSNNNFGCLNSGIELKEVKKHFNQLIKDLNDLDNLSEIYSTNPLIRFGYRNRNVPLFADERDSDFYNYFFQLIIHLHSQIFIEKPNFFPKIEKSHSFGVKLMYKDHCLVLLNS